MMLNVLDRLPERDQVQAKMMLKRIPYIETRKNAGSIVEPPTR